MHLPETFIGKVGCFGMRSCVSDVVGGIQLCKIFG